MGIRLLLIVLTLWGLFTIVRRFLIRVKTPPQKRDHEATADMVQCRVCGTYLPESEALQRGDDFFCSPEHLTQDHDEQ